MKWTAGKIICLNIYSNLLAVASTNWKLPVTNSAQSYRQSFVNDGKAAAVSPLRTRWKLTHNVRQC